MSGHGEAWRPTAGRKRRSGRERDNLVGISPRIWQEQEGARFLSSHSTSYILSPAFSTMTTESNPSPDSTDNPPASSQSLPPSGMTIAHPPKKKRVDDQASLPPDLGTKPIQLQRRRVWRACESCRYVRAPFYAHDRRSRSGLNHLLPTSCTLSFPFRTLSVPPLPSSSQGQIWSLTHVCSLLPRRKKIKCDGVEPTCSQCASSKSQCTWLQTKDRAALSRQ